MALFRCFRRKEFTVKPSLATDSSGSATWSARHKAAHATAGGGSKLAFVGGPCSSGLHFRRFRGVKYLGTSLRNHSHDGSDGYFICAKRGTDAPRRRRISAKPPIPSTSVCRRNIHSGLSVPGAMRPKRMPMYSPISSIASNHGRMGSNATSGILSCSLQFAVQTVNQNA